MMSLTRLSLSNTKKRSQFQAEVLTPAFEALGKLCNIVLQWCRHSCQHPCSSRSYQCKEFWGVQSIRWSHCRDCHWRYCRRSYHRAACLLCPEKAEGISRLERQRHRQGRYYKWCRVWKWRQWNYSKEVKRSAWPSWGITHEAIRSSLEWRRWDQVY